MPPRFRELATTRAGQSSPLVVCLLAGIFVALIILIFAVVRRPSVGSTEAQGGGGTVTVEPAHTKPTPPPNQERIRETAKVGKTYHIVLKAGFESRAEDKDWGVRKVISLAYAGEFAVDRTIELNDGQKIVELRRFTKARCVKLLSNVEDIKLELGLPGTLILGALDSYLPGTMETAIAAKPIVEKVLQLGSQDAVNNEMAKAFAQVDSIQGKQVRLTYIAGKGVVAMEPVGCVLTKSEEQYLLTTALLSDYYIMPDLKIPAGGTWSVPGNQFGFCFDPSWKGTPSGTVVIRRDSDSTKDGQPLATLRVESGIIDLDATDNQKRRVGSFTPRGTLDYRLNDQFVQSAQLIGQFQFEEVSKDHLLFEARLHTQPKLQIDYFCEMR